MLRIAVIRGIDCIIGMESLRNTFSLNPSSILRLRRRTGCEPFVRAIILGLEDDRLIVSMACGIQRDSGSSLGVATAASPEAHKPPVQESAQQDQAELRGHEKPYAPERHIISRKFRILPALHPNVRKFRESYLPDTQGIHTSRKAEVVNSSAKCQCSGLPRFQDFGGVEFRILGLSVGFRVPGFGSWAFTD